MKIEGAEPKRLFKQKGNAVELVAKASLFASVIVFDESEAIKKQLANAFNRKQYGEQNCKGDNAG
jgi:hypothetical protein